MRMRPETIKKLQEANFNFNWDHPEPTLDDLIAGCNTETTKFKELQYYPNKNAEGIDWWATGRKIETDDHFERGGKEPREAVANVYLALKGKE